VQDACLIFLHLPKSGGSTLTTLLRWQYRNLHPSEIVPFDTAVRTFEEFGRLPFEQRAHLKLLVGHFAYGVHGSIPKPCSYITIVREPVQRVVSVYRYVLSAPHPPLHETLTSSISLEDYVGSEIHADQPENALTRQLAGRDEDDDLTTSDLEIAKGNLRNCRAAGLSEAFDESVTLFKRILGWRTPPFYFNRNVSRRGPHPDEVADATLELMRERNASDVELYAAARSTFSLLVSQQGPGFEKEVNLFKRINRIPQALGGVLDPIAPMIRRRLERRVVRRSFQHEPRF
jgi:hypothetical protein